MTTVPPAAAHPVNAELAPNDLTAENAVNAENAVPIGISTEVRALIAHPEPAVLTTLRADGSPSSSVMWLTVDGDSILLPTKRNRIKVRHIERDPRVSIVVYDRNQITRYVQITGTAELTDYRASSLIYDLSELYTGSRAHQGADDREDLRVVIRVTPERIFFRS
jgi:PPOX class probable F420-dependent enzyme